MVGLLVALGKLLLLGGKAGPLVDGIVQLRVGVGHLPSVHEELKPLHVVRILGLPFRQRGNLNRVIHDEGGLNQMLLHIGLEEQIENISLLVPLLIFDMMLLRGRPGFLQGMDFVEIHPGILLYGVLHGNPGEGLAKVHFHAVVDDPGGAEHFLGHMAVHVFRQVHHAVIVRIGLVKLHQGEFRIVPGVQPLIPEYASDLVHAFQPADDQPLQIQLQADPQLEILVQGVEMGFEGAGRRAAGVCDQHGGFDLHETLAVQEAADGAEDPGPLDEGILAVRIHDQIHVPLAVPQIHIRQPVELLRQGLERLAQQGEGNGVHRDFSGFGFENRSADADDVADVILLEGRVGLLAHRVPGHVHLHHSLQILHVAEARLAHDALGHQPSGDRDLASLQGIKLLPDLAGMMGHVVFPDLEGIHSRFLQRRQLLPADPGLFA